MKLSVILADNFYDMRSESEIKNLIHDIAKKDERIRAVLLNGSRANPQITPDIFQDFDILFIVDDVESFTNNHGWIQIFGDTIITQLPDEMTFGKSTDAKNPIVFHYLMLFKDRNRIDLTLFPKQKFNTGFTIDSQTILCLDKDNLFPHLPEPCNKDYHIQRPTEKEFSDTCNEFWWVSTYVAKGLRRNEITYAKEMLETAVRPMFMKIIEWKIGLENNFLVSFGKAGKLMKNYLTEDYYSKVLQTYSNADREANWKALFIMIEIFEQTSTDISKKLNFQINKREQKNVIEYLRQQYEEQSNSTKK